MVSLKNHYAMGMSSDLKGSHIIVNGAWASLNAATPRFVDIFNLIRDNVISSILHKDEVVWKSSEDGKLKMPSGRSSSQPLVV